MGESVLLLVAVYFLGRVLAAAPYARKTADAWREVAEYYEGQIEKRKREQVEHEARVRDARREREVRS